MTENYDGKSFQELSIAVISKDNSSIIKPVITVISLNNIEIKKVRIEIDTYVET